MKPKKPFTKFGPWFKEQFPFADAHHKKKAPSWERVSNLKFMLEKAEDEIGLIEESDKVHDAALKGWVAGYEACKREMEKK